MSGMWARWVEARHMPMNATRSLGALLAAGLITAGLAGAASARRTIGSGDTCTATGGGTSYTLRIDVASTNPEQYGFAVGASGARVRSISVTAVEGSYMSGPLPQGASGTWISSSRIEPGPVVAVVTTSGPAKSFTVTPASQPSPPAYFDSISCSISATAPVAKAGTFTVSPRVTYDAASKAWKLTVTLASAGRVSAVQPEPTVGGAYPTSKTAKPEVQSRSVARSGAGVVTLTLRPTALGSSTLARSGAIKLKLLVTFFPTGGKATHRLVALVLKK